MDGPPGQGPSGIAAGAAVQAGSTRLEGQPITPFRDRRPVVQPSSRTALYLYFWSMKGHAFTAYLRVYQPLAAFPPRERASWAAYVETGQTLPASLLVVREERRGLARALGMSVDAEPEHALVERVGDVVYVCPLRTELRTLESLVAFRSSVPDEVADAFVSARDVERATRALERLNRDRPGWRSHIQQAAWHVPLPWFALFDAEERRLDGPTQGQPPRLTYRTTMAKARARVSRAVSILQELMEDADMVVAAEELREWLHAFDPDSMVQLDYGGLTRAIPFEELAEDRSAGEVWEALEALEEGDLDRSSGLYRILSERWSALRGRESSN